MFKNLLRSFVVKISLLTILLTISLLEPTYGQTVLAPGDIAIIAINTDGSGSAPDDVIKLVTFVDLECSTTFIVTDNKWDAGAATWSCQGDDGNAEFGLTLRVDNKVCAGSVISIIDNGNNDFAASKVTSSSGTVTPVLNHGTSSSCADYGDDSGLSSGADQVFVITGGRCSPTFIYGVNNNSNWTGASGCEKKTTDKPSSLNASFSLLTGGKNYFYYDFTKGISGTKSALQTLMANAANWKSSGANAATWGVATSFTITPTVCVSPPIEATVFTASGITSSKATIGWNNCSGGLGNVLVIITANASVTSNPVTGTAYTANTVFGSGSQIGSGNYVAYIGNGNGITVTGLTAAATYHVAIYTISCAGNCYSTSPLPGSFGTISLPVDLIYFYPDKGKNNAIDFEWVTAYEINNDYFEIEASKDGTTFLSIGKVKGSGNSHNYKNYNYSWVSEKEFLYFRLKEVDYDGGFHYSIVETISSDEAIEFEVFPVPAAEELFVKINSREEVVISILDIVGKEVYSSEIISENGIFPLDIKNFVAGIYTIVITSDNKVISKRFYKE